MNLATSRVVVVAVAALGWSLGPVSQAGAAGKASFAELVADLKSPNTSTRLAAVTELGKSRRREAVAPLSPLVRDPETKVRMAAVQAFRSLRDLGAVPALITSMSDGDTRIREEAIGTLVELYAERERSGPVAGFLHLFSDEDDRASLPPFTSVDPAVFQALGTALRDEDKVIRKEAADALGILGGTPAMPALQGALQDTEAEVRAAAARSIGKIGGAQDGKSLIPLLADESTTVRDVSLQAIGVLRVREAGPALRELFEANRKKELGTKALASLSRIGDPAQADFFRELLQDPDLERRRLAIEGLGRVADPAAAPAFKKDYQREKSDDLRLAYAFSLTKLGDRAFVDSLVLALPTRGLGARAKSYLLELGSSLLGDLYPYLTDPEPEIRASLCDIIAQMGDADSVGRLNPLLSDPNTKVADRANRAVEMLRRAPGATGAKTSR
jgi:HEAT repeat protein